MDRLCIIVRGVPHLSFARLFTAPPRQCIGPPSILGDSHEELWQNENDPQLVGCACRGRIPKPTSPSEATKEFERNHLAIRIGFTNGVQEPRRYVKFPSVQRYPHEPCERSTIGAWRHGGRGIVRVSLNMRGEWRGFIPLL